MAAPLVHNRPGRLKPFIRNGISGDKSVHEPIVRRPAHSGRLVGVLVIGRVAAKPQVQCCERAGRALSNLVSRLSAQAGL
jgi:hypothetical protein